MKILINNKKKNEEWKIQLIIKINFVSSKKFSEVKSHNAEIMMGIDTNEIIEKLFDYMLERYQKGLEESMEGSDFMFDYVESLNYIFHKIFSYFSDLKRSGSYIEAPE